MKNFTNSCFAVIASLLMLSCADHLSSHEDAQPVSLSAKLEASTLDRVQEIALAAPAQFPSYNATKAKEKKIAEIVPISTTKWAKDVKEMNDAQELLTEAIDDIYIVNYADNDGYAIVSTNKYMPEVLALIDSGNYKEEAEVPGGFEIFMERLPFYAMQQLKEAKSKAITKSVEPDTIPDPDGYVRLNFREETVLDEFNNCGRTMYTQWGQDDPYNLYCPDIFYNSGGNMVLRRAKAGCAAIAIGQVSAVKNYPSSATWNNVTLTLNWQTIANTASISNLNSTDREAVARYIRQVGDLASIEYVDGSWTNMINIRSALISLGFSASSVLDYDYDLLFQGVSFYGPAIVTGFPYYGALSGGHTWIIDACNYRTYSYYKIADLYDAYYNYCGIEIIEERHWTNRYVHCNWGYGGISDGTFTSGVFSCTTEDNENLSLSAGVCMIINIDE